MAPEWPPHERLSQWEGCVLALAGWALAQHLGSNQAAQRVDALCRSP